MKMRKTILALAAISLAIPAAPVLANSDSDSDRRWRKHDNNGRHYRNDNRRGRVYDDRGRYYEPRRISHNDRVWRGNDGRYYCERGNGTTGLIIGAAGGALLGREIDGGRDRTLGTVLGGAAGALLGREIDRGGAKCR